MMRAVRCASVFLAGFHRIFMVNLDQTAAFNEALEGFLESVEKRERIR